MAKSFLEGVEDYLKRGLTPFQTPGHKQGRWVSEDLKALMGEKPFQIDLSEPGDGSLGETLAGAQRRAAEKRGVIASFFLWNGTTGGILASFLAACSGRRVVLPRAAHRSVFAALALADAVPLYVQPEVLPGWEIFLPTEPAAFHRKLGDAACLFLTHPTYWGLVREWQPLFAAAHEKDMPVIVDQAHGPHFPASSRLPGDALRQGADLVIESTHKVSTALTQSSMLHLGSGRIEPFLIEEALQLVQSTSPSFLLLCSLEAAALKEDGSLWEETVELAAWSREKLNEAGWQVLAERDLPRGVSLDPTRLVVNVGARGYSGIGAADFLKERAGVVVEMADQGNLLFLLTPGDDKESVKKILEGLRLLLVEGAKDKKEIAMPPFPQSVLSPRKALLGPKRALSLKDAVGELAASMVVPYPPGIPLLVPGEEIEAAQLEYLAHILALGWQVDGLVAGDKILVYTGG